MDQQPATESTSTKSRPLSKRAFAIGLGIVYAWLILMFVLYVHVFVSESGFRTPDYVMTLVFLAVALLPIASIQESRRARREQEEIDALLEEGRKCQEEQDKRIEEEEQDKLARRQVRIPRVILARELK